MKPLLTTALLLAVACAAQAQSGTSTAAAPPPSGNGDATHADHASRTGHDTVADRDCLRETGSRITSSANNRARKAGKPASNCVAASGRSYSKQDLDRTGETNTADALRKLDPSIR
ncbi:MAG: hypothetical protein ACREO8_12350 [Luteimonas sp.]